MIIFSTPLPQVPLPTGEVWVQFPIIAVLVLCFAATFAGLFVFIRWAWGAYQKNKAIDMKWREEQNEKRELAQDMRDEKMTRFFISVSAGNAANISEIMRVLENLLASYNSHDTQAKQIGAAVAEIRGLMEQLRSR